MTMEDVRNHVWNGVAWVPAQSSVIGGTSTVHVDNFPATQPVSATALPLPTGAATETSLGTDGAGESPANGTGIRGWLRSIFDKLTAGIAITNFPATQPVSNASLPLPTGAATEASLGTDGAGESPANGTGIRGWLRSIFDKLTAGISITNFPATQPVSGTVAVSGSVNTGVQATSGGTSATRVISAATTNATVAKASSGRLFFGIISNSSASARYLKLYNKATAPTVGTDTPVLTVLCPPAITTRFDFSAIGLYFSTGISFAITGAIADSDTTAIVAGELIAQIYTF